MPEMNGLLNVLGGMVHFVAQRSKIVAVFDVVLWLILQNYMLLITKLENSELY